MNLQNWDLKKNGTINLSGQWEFYKSQFINPGIDFNKLTSRRKLQRVPAPWNSPGFFQDFNSGTGFGTYRLIIKLNNSSSTKNLALKVLNILSSYTLYINGEQISTVGKAGKDEKTSRPGKKPGVVFLSNNSFPVNQLELIIHVSNFFHKNGGITQNIALGSANQISRLREKNVIIEFFLFGLMVVIALYHIGIFLMNKYDRSLLYFGLLCLSLSIWIMLSNEKICEQFIPNLNWKLTSKLEYISIYLSFPLIALFLSSMFKKEYNKKILFSILGTGTFLVCCAIFCSNIINSYTFTIFQILIILLLVYSLYVIIKAFKNKKGAANILLFAVSFLLATILMEIIFNFPITDVSHSLLLGIFFMAIANSYLVALKFTNAVSLIEDLTEDLAETTIEIEKKNIKLLDLNWNLEQKVKSRTEELENALDKLEKTNQDLEAAQEEARNDLEMAIRVQKNFLPQRIPESKEWEIAFHMNPMSGVSGDFYDFYIEEDEVQGVGIFDVSGHGVSSGLITTLAKSIIHRNFINNIEKPLNEILVLSNKELQKELKEIFHYVTGVLLKFNKNTVSYVSAGHPEIILKRNNKAQKVLNENNRHISGSILGIENINDPYEQIKFQASPGDFILLYTDGLIESSNNKKESFEIENILKYMNNAPNDSASSALDYLLENFYDFIDNKASSDDVTCIMLKKL